MVAFVFGQSNAASFGSERFEAVDDRVVNYWNGKYYRAADPLLGATGQSDSPWVAMANRLLARQQVDQVILVAAGVDGSSVRAWRQGGRLHSMLEARLQELRRQHLSVTHFLWHQGEQDNPAAGPVMLDADAYKTGLPEVIALTKRYFPESSFFMAQVSLCGRSPVSAELVGAQAEMARLGGVFLGPNTDRIGLMDRYDGCHMSGRGLVKHAKAWVEALENPRKQTQSAAQSPP